MSDGARSGTVMGWIFGCWSRHPLAMILLVIAGDVALIALHATRLRALIFGEDRAVEIATALLFLAAFVAGLRAMWRGGRQHYPVLLPLAAVLGLVGFLDEVSFGARLFDWSMPEMMGGGEFDGAHDVVILTYRLAARADPLLIAFAGGGIGILGLICAARWRKALDGLARRIVTDPTWSAMALFVAGVSFASLLDLEIGVLRHLGPLEEIAELNAALALIVALMSASRPRTQLRNSSRIRDF